MTTITLTNTGTWTLPADWNDAANTIEVYGSGGNGAFTSFTTQSGGGGGGGAYVKGVNVPLKAQFQAGWITNFNYSVNTAGTGFATIFAYYDPDTGLPVYQDQSIATAGSSANNTFGGGGGIQGSIYIYSGGLVDVKTIFNAGGAGGNGRASSTAAGGGGGGAGGPNGVGGAGGSNTTTLPTVGRGGGGANGGTAGSSIATTGGVGSNGGGNGGNGGIASTSGTNGFAGTTVYSGGGGGGAGDGSGTNTGGNGGGYGGGGGGQASFLTSSAGTGALGIIVINYTPIAGTNTSNFFMMF